MKHMKLLGLILLTLSLGACATPTLDQTKTKKLEQTAKSLSKENLLLDAKAKELATSKTAGAEAIKPLAEKEAALKKEVAEKKDAVAKLKEEEAALSELESVSSENALPAGSLVLSNGNTAGAVGMEAARRMAAETGEPVQVWEEIIARESGGDPNAQNPSGASGLFQTMPFWGSTATVEDQIQTALRAYFEAQRTFGNGLQPWGMESYVSIQQGH